MNDDTPEAAKRGRSAKPKRPRRNFAAELASLQSRVALAVRLLSKVAGGAENAEALVSVAIEMLQVE